MKKIAIFIIVTGAVLFACKKNDSGSGQPVITQVRAVDSTKRDSTFAQAIPGTLIVIQGSNFSDLQAVFFNDTSAYFNPTYVTNTNIIISIPATAQTAATDPNVPSIIKVVTSHGTAQYSFKLYLPPPAIYSLAFDNSGTVVYINGANFEGVQKVTFPVSGNDTALSYTINKTFTQIAATIPPGTAFKDSLRVYCTFGSSAYSYPPPMSITSVSNENAAAGSTITITGTNFVGIEKVIFPGGIETNNVHSLGVSQISVIVPSGITAPDSISISGALGKAVAPRIFDSYFSHPSPGYISTFENQWNLTDNTCYVGWTAGYQTAPSTTYPNSSGNFVSFTGKAPATGSVNWYYDNSMAMRSNPLPWVANPSTAKASDYLLQFEAYVNFDWKAGGIYFTTNTTGGNHLYEWAPWQNAPGGIYHPSGWFTVTFPLSAIVTGAYNNSAGGWQYNPTGNSPSMVTDLTGNTGADALFVYFTNFTKNDINGIDVAFDNFRIVKGN